MSFNNNFGSQAALLYIRWDDHNRLFTSVLNYFCFFLVMREYSPLAILELQSKFKR